MTTKFAQISKAGIGMYIVVAVEILKQFGYHFDVSMATEAVFYILQGIGALLWIAGQLLRKDLKWGIFRKESD